MTPLPVTRVVLYKHGVGYFERQGPVSGDATMSLTFKQTEVSDVLKSLTVLDLDGGHIASVSYDSTKPLEQLLAEVALHIPDDNSLIGLLPQIKGARVEVVSPGEKPLEGVLIGVDHAERQSADGIVKSVLVSLLTDAGEGRSLDLHSLATLRVLDPALRRDLEYYLRTQLSAKKKDARTFTFFAQGQGERKVLLSYTLEAPVWKATYRILLGEEGKQPMIQGWAVVDNTQDEDWENVELSLVAGLPVSFVHDLYTPRYIRRPVVAVQETTGVLPPTVEEGMDSAMYGAAAPELQAEKLYALREAAAGPPGSGAGGRGRFIGGAKSAAPSSTPAQVRERKLGDLFEYQIEHPVTIRRNQSALVPIVLRSFQGRPVLLYNKATREDNPMRCVEFRNTTGLILEGGPVTVLEGGSYVGEAMLDTLKPDEERLVPYAVELSVHVLDNVKSHEEKVSQVVIRKGTLTTYFNQIIVTTYHLNNKSDTEQTLYLEHPRPDGQWKLFDTAEPHEVTKNYWRFRFPLPAKKVTEFAVSQKKTLHRSFAFVSMSDEQVQFWLDQKFLDKRTGEVLKKARGLRQQAAGFEAEIARLEKERDRIHADQKRIRENLSSLGDRSSEKELRERFVRTLNTQEDRLEAITAEITAATLERNRCTEELNAVLEKLDFEAEV